MTVAEVDAIDQALDALFEAYWSRQPHMGGDALEVLKDLPEAAQLRSLSAPERAEAAARSVERITAGSRAAQLHLVRAAWEDRGYIAVQTFRSVASMLLASKLPLQEPQLHRVLTAMTDHECNDVLFPLGRIVTALDRYAKGEGVSDGLAAAIDQLRDRVFDPHRARLDAILRRAARTQPDRSRQGERCSDVTSLAQRDSQAEALLEEFLKHCGRHASIRDAPVKPYYDKVRAAAKEAQVAVVRLALDRIASIARELDEPEDRRVWQLVNYHFTRPWATGLSECIAALLRRKLPFSDSDLLACVNSCAEYEVVSDHFMPHVRALCKVLEDRYADAPPPADVAKAIGRLAEIASRIGNTPEHRISRRLRALAAGPLEFPMRPGEAWSDRALADLSAMSAADQGSWSNLLEHCSQAPGSSPSAKWARLATEALQQVEDFQRVVLPWFALVDKPSTEPRHPMFEWSPDPTYLIIDPHADLLKGLCWASAAAPSPDLARALGALAISCYRKVPGIGPRAVRIGNAAVWALSQMPGPDALGQLAMLRIKVKYGGAQKALEKALDAAATREGLPRDEIDELAVPAYGLTEVGLRAEQLGDITAELVIDGPDAAVRWRKADGTLQKSIPAAAKRDHADDLKELKAAAKDIGRMLPAQRDRLDGLFSQRRSWPVETWRTRYLDHPLIGTLARRLIWTITPAGSKGGEPRDAIWLAEEAAASDAAASPAGGALVDLEGRPFDPPSTATVELWHPLGRPVEQVLAWRRFLEDRRIRQPFKQAHREVYLLTDAERTTNVYSNRYAAHILRQHQFNALCAARGWKNTLRLMVDQEFPPASRPLPQWNLRAEFWIEGAGDEYGTDTNESGTFHYLVTDQVRFYPLDAALRTAHAYGGGFRTQGEEGSDTPLPLADIPPLVFSEIMRDIDLFVGVASVGNNPEWQDGGPEGRYQQYWSDYSFGELSATAETRREILARLLPRLKIASQCELEDRFLRIRGSRRTYRIHLGSGNILMEPGDQYLCIVPSYPRLAGGNDIWLPFEGDRTLSIILSKAMLLAADDTITDGSILSQIG